MRQALDLKVSQKLVMTLQQRQSLRLLQSSTIELLTEIRQAMQDNPMLELYESGENESQPEVIDQYETSECLTEPSWDTFTATARADLNHDYMTEKAYSVSMQEYLLEQLGSLRLSELMRQRVAFLIGNLNEDGYLTDSLQTLSQNWLELTAGASSEMVSHQEQHSAQQADEIVVKKYTSEEHQLEHKYPVNSKADRAVDYDTLSEHEGDDILEDWLIALRLLQSFDPVGVGARDLAECLLLQLRDKARDNAISPSSKQNIAGAGQVDTQELDHHHRSQTTVSTAQAELASTARDDYKQVLQCAQQICEQGLEALADAKIDQLQLITKASVDTIKQAHKLIQQLEPRPGKAWHRSLASYIVPDVLIKKTAENWLFFINPAVKPRLRVNKNYEHMLKLMSKNDAHSMQEQLNQARQLLRQVNHRFTTILSVAQTIMMHQLDFLQYGKSALKPLTLKEVASELGVHESTISRAVAQKYIATPHGIFELNYFFGSSLSTQSGEQVSAKVIQGRIQQLVQGEPANKPLSDARISMLLEQEGVLVARRTVAKYREQINIAAASVRKAQAKLSSQ